MGYQGAIKRKPKGLMRGFFASAGVGVLGTLVAWVAADSIITYDHPFMGRLADVSWWFAAAPVRIIESLFRLYTSSNPADATSIEIASTCFINGMLAGIALVVGAAFLGNSRTEARVPSSAKNGTLLRKVSKLLKWGAAIGFSLTLTLIGLAYATPGGGGDSGSFLVWWAMCLPLVVLANALGFHWPDPNHGPSAANILMASLTNGLLLAGILALFPLIGRFLLLNDKRDA